LSPRADGRPLCPTCGAAWVDHPLAESVELWLEGEEPVAVCPACAKSHPLGDWVGEFIWYVAEIAVSFNNWPTIDRQFLDELGRLFGPRWRIVYLHT
jgi:hypothetical protein